MKSYAWKDLIIGIVPFIGCGYWTAHLALNDSLWALLTGWLALLGFFIIVNVFFPEVTRPATYETVKDDIQNAVTAYASDHSGNFPTIDRKVKLVNPEGSYDVINICALLVKKGGILRKVPDGVSTFNCPEDNQHNIRGSYTWLLDKYGNVLSICTNIRCSTSKKRKDGYQDIWP